MAETVDFIGNLSYNVVSKFYIRKHQKWRVNMSDRGQLEAEIQQLEEEANVLRRRNDETGYHVKMAEVNAKKAELSAIDISNIAEEVKTSEFPFILTVAGEEINFRDWIHQEVNYQVIAIGVSQKIYELEALRTAQLAERDQLIDQEREQFRAQLTAADVAADARFNELSEKSEAQSFEVAKLNAELALLRTQNHDLRNERDDYERKHQAATSEIESLKNQLSVVQVKETPVITNMDSGALAEAIRIANEAKPRIYNKRAGDQRTSFYLANLVDTGAEISIPWTRIGQYVEVSDEEAARFRAELEANKIDITEAEEPIQSDLELAVPIESPTIEAPQLPSNTVQEHTMDGEVDEEATGPNVAETWEQWVERTLLNLVGTVNSLTPESVISGAKPPVREAA